MPASTKVIKTRIKSVKNTKKITKAMEMVSAAKMRKAVDATLSTRLYAARAFELMQRLSELQEPDYPLFSKRPVKKILAVLVSSNRGLCGSFNSNISKFAGAMLSDIDNLAVHRNQSGDVHIAPEKNVSIDILGIGRKSAVFAKGHDLNLIEVYEGLTDKPDIDSVVPISKSIIEHFCSGTYDKVVVVYTHFESSLSQVPKVRQVLPLSDIDIQKMMRDVDRGQAHVSPEYELPIDCYFLEPDRDMILDVVIPRLVDIQLYQAVLESTASEHSARMVAMKNASDAASEMIDSLTLAFNKARQAAITQEIAEIAGGAAALE
jgi:F-type H+-transporting ATPase subunit gamma